MNDLENPSAHSEDTNEKIESLRSQMNLLFGCMLVASLTLTLYLGLQARRVSIEAFVLKGQAGDYVLKWRQDNATINDNLSKLAEFARTHPDFQKIVRFNTNAPQAAVAVPPAKK